MAFTDGVYFPESKSPKPSAPLKPRCKLCLSIDMDDQSYGDMLIDATGTRLLVDEQQARQLAALLNEHLNDRAMLGDSVAIQGVKMLHRQLEHYMASIHCNEQTPPADGNSK